MLDRFFVLIAMIASLFTAASTPGMSEPVRIRAGWITAPASLIPIMFAKAGLARHNGVSYRLEEIHFNASPLQITALANGDLEIGTLGYSSFPLAVQNAGLADLRIIADETQDGAEGYYATEFMVRKDSAIDRIDQLKGKVFASNGTGSGVDIVLRSVLKEHGLLDKRDYTTIESAFPTHKALLKDRKVDLIIAPAPFSFDAELREFAQTLFDVRGAFGPVQLAFWLARRDFIEKNRDAMVDLLEDYIRAIQWYADPVNHDEAAAIVANFLKRPPNSLDWVFTHRDYYRDPNGIPNLNALQTNVEKAADLGFFKPMQVREFIDFSLLSEANNRVR